MAFNVENGSGSTLDIDDLGITLDTGEITDLALRGDPAIIAISAQAGDEISNLITSGDLIIKDPFDGTTNLSVADGLAVARSINDPHWRLGQGARMGDISDTDFTSLTTDEVQQFDGTNWVNVTPAEVGAGASFTLAWRFSTTTTAADPGNSRFRYDNSTLASVTNIYFDDNADGGFDVGTIFSLLASGDKIYIQQSSDATKAALFTLSGVPVDNTGWWTVPVSVDDSGTLHDNNAKCATIFFTSGGGGGTDELVKVSANDTTADYLENKIVGVTNETVVATLNDGADEDLEIGIADNPTIPGTEGVVPPVGTTAQRPGTPDDGEMRFNSNTNLLEYYDGTEWVSVSGNSTGPGTIQGNILGYHYLSDNNKAMYSSWLGTTTRHIASNTTQYVMPFDGEIVAITYGNSEESSDVDFEINIAAEGAGAADSTVYTWDLRDARVARNSLLVAGGGPSGIVLAKGDKMGVFVAADPGGGTEPQDIVLSVFVQWTNEPNEESVEDYAGDF